MKEFLIMRITEMLESASKSQLEAIYWMLMRTRKGDGQSPQSALRLTAPLTKGSL